VRRRLAPLRRISPPKDHCISAHRGLYTQWSRSLATAFPSPATAASSQKPPFRGLWSRPATSRPCQLVPRPVRLQLLCRLPVCPSRWRNLSYKPVAVHFASALGCFLCLHYPPGLLPPSGSKRSTDSAASRLTFRIRPITVRSPPPVLFLVFGCGSSFPVRYFSGGLLFLISPLQRCEPQGRGIGSALPIQTSARFWFLFRGSKR